MIKCCQVGSVTTVGANRQVTLPQGCCEPGDKVTFINWLQDGKTCCLSLVKGEVTVEEFAEMTKKVTIE
jgi:hypothetical protein